MKSVSIERYGDARALAIRDVPAAAPGPNEVRVKVRASSINAADLHMLHGTPFPLRLAMGWSRPHRIRGFGADVAGVVESVGASVETLRVGDEVFGDLSGCGFGAASELVTAPAEVLIRKPGSLSFEQAAAVPMAAMTALRGLRDVAELRRGQRLLVVGATGGVGSFAVQLGAFFGADVTAVVRPEKQAALAGLGAARLVAPHALDDGTVGTFDVVFDAAAYRPPFGYRSVLGEGGRYVLAGGDFSAIVKVGLFGGLVGLFTGRSFRTFLSTPDMAELAYLGGLCDAGTLRPLVDRVHPLDEVQDAVARIERREATGKVVLSVGP